MKGVGVWLFHRGILPDKLFYSHPFQFLSSPPPGFYKTIWTLNDRELRDNLFCTRYPNLHVLMEIDWFAFLLGGLIAVGYSFYNGEITRKYRYGWPQATTNFEDTLPAERIPVLLNLYTRTFVRFFVRFGYGGVMYHGLRYLTHFTWLNIFRGSDQLTTNFKLSWTAGTSFAMVCAHLYTAEVHETWKIIISLWIGLGLTFAENTWEILRWVVTTLTKEQQALLL